MAKKPTGLVPALIRYPGTLPPVLLDALLGREEVRTVAVMSTLIARPEITRAHTQALVDRFVTPTFARLDERATQRLLKAHIALTEPGPELDEIFVSLARSRRACGGMASAGWHNVMSAIATTLPIGHATYLHTSPNLLAMAVIGGHSPGFSSLKVLELAHRRLPACDLDPEEKAHVVSELTRVMRKVRKDSVWDGQAAVLSATTPETIAYLVGGFSTGSDVTTLEARHLVNVVVLPNLDAGEQTEDGRYHLLDFLNSNGGKLSTLELTALRDHPNVTTDVRESAEANLNADREERFSSLLRNVHDTQAATEALLDKVAQLDLPWDGVLHVLDRIPASTGETIDEMLTIARGVLH